MIRYVPQSQLRTFEILRKTAIKDAKGRITYNADNVVGEMRGSVSTAKQREIEQWKQNGHPITHTIVVRGETTADAEDVLRLENRSFYVQGKYNPADLHIYAILYCEERAGV